MQSHIAHCSLHSLQHYHQKKIYFPRLKDAFCKMICRAASRNCNIIRRWIFYSSCRVSTPFQHKQKPFSSLFLISSPPSLSPSPPQAFPIKMGFCMRRHCYSSQAVVGSTEDGVVDVPLAQTGEGIAECELLKWFVQEGDQVEDFQPLCEVQSDKATIEITSRYKGKVAKILYTPGDIVKVGETLLKMVVEESLTSNVTSHGSKSVLSSDLNALLSGSLISVPDRSDVGVLSTPAVRSIAKKLGIGIGDVQGTGKDGRVLKKDVMTYAVQRGVIEDSSSSSSSSSEDEEHTSHLSSSDGGGFVDKRIPLRGFQRTMVKTMTIAAKVPHFHYVEEINCDALIDLKTAFQNDNQDPDIKHTFLPLLIKSLSVAMNRYPLLNGCFSEETHEVILKGSHNIGVAMATQHGLVVPNIKKVQSLSILDITKELSRLQKLASANKLSPEDISGGTITLSNIGAIGGRFGSPLLNLPEVSIIAIGRIQKVPHISDDGNVYPASVMTVNIGADHRVLDGATVARFCNEWKLYIEKPELLLLNLK